MTKRLFTAQAQSWTAQATGGALTSATYMSIFSPTSGVVVDIDEVLISGFATSSTVMAMNLTQVSSLSATNTALATPNSDAPMVAYGSALATPIVSLVAAGTGPTASAAATAAKLNLGLNGFGGIIRWNAAPTQQYTIVGATAPNGQCVLFNSSTGGGATGSANAHII